MTGLEVDRWVAERLGEYRNTAALADGYESTHAAVSFVLRALVNPAQSGSGRVLDEIVAERVRLEAQTEA